MVPEDIMPIGKPMERKPMKMALVRSGHASDKQCGIHYQCSANAKTAEESEDHEQSPMMILSAM